MRRNLSIDVFKKTCEFMLSAHNYSQTPPEKMPEIAFAGRSNVGKSSLINALFNNSKIARVSNTPGRTQHLNFFNVNNLFIFVDMPGYGFAKAPKKHIAQWENMINQYILKRATLKRIYLLIDARHGIKKNDSAFMGNLDKVGLSYQLVFTKADKISKTQYIKVVEETENTIKNHPAAFPSIIATSSEKRIGLNELRKSILNACFHKR